MPSRPALSLALRHGLLVAGLMFACALRAEPREQIIWTVRDMPPFSIQEGPHKGQGIADKMLTLIRQRLPQYEHINSRVNRARANQMLAQNKLSCDPGLLWSKERTQMMYFSIPTFGLMTNGVITRADQQEQLAPFIQQGKLDLGAFLADPRFNLGLLVERSYGEVIDAQLKQAKPGHLVVHHGNDALGSLLQMQQHGRITAVAGYWPETRYVAKAHGIDQHQLRFYPVQGVPTYQLAYVTCSKTPQGLKAIQAINQVIRDLRGNEIAELYAEWLDKPTRAAYLQAAKTFFDE